jgi:hypothetical protein
VPVPQGSRPKKMTKFPKYQKHSTIDGGRYLIMEYLPMSIEEFIEQ